jgi:hypothetical protein
LQSILEVLQVHPAGAGEGIGEEGPLAVRAHVELEHAIGVLIEDGFIALIEDFEEIPRLVFVKVREGRDLGGGIVSHPHFDSHLETKVRPPDRLATKIACVVNHAKPSFRRQETPGKRHESSYRRILDPRKGIYIRVHRTAARCPGVRDERE